MLSELTKTLESITNLIIFLAINDSTKTPEIESACHTTLGWMLFRCPALGEKESRIRSAISHLNRATQVIFCLISK